MSNRKSSNAQKMIKRWGKMAEGYQDRIERQVQAIDRLVAATAAQGDALYGIEHEAKNIKEARKWAKDAQARVKDILAVPSEGDNSE